MSLIAAQLYTLRDFTRTPAGHRGDDEAGEGDGV